ncbi:hypothetical protein COOONC_00490 [Cooperia oncophora]
MLSGFTGAICVTVIRKENEDGSSLDANEIINACKATTAAYNNRSLSTTDLTLTTSPKKPTTTLSEVQLNRSAQQKTDDKGSAGDASARISNPKCNKDYHSTLFTYAAGQLQNRKPSSQQGRPPHTASLQAPLMTNVSMNSNCSEHAPGVRNNHSRLSARGKALLNTPLLESTTPNRQPPSNHRATDCISTDL